VEFARTTHHCGARRGRVERILFTAFRRRSQAAVGEEVIFKGFPARSVFFGMYWMVMGEVGEAGFGADEDIGKARVIT